MKRTTTIRRSALARFVVVARLRRLLPAGLGTLAILFTLLGSVPRVAAQSSLASNNGMIVADFNHDGIPDVLVPNGQLASFTISFGAVPYGTFGTVAKLVSYPGLCANVINGSVVVGDFNGDGIPDIAMACFGGQLSSTEIFILLGNGDGTFTTGTPIQGLSNVILGDFNKDGKLDIVTEGANANNQQTLLFYVGNGDGTFGTAVGSSLPNHIYSAGVAVDVNQDGYPDLVLGNFSTSQAETVDVYGNNHDGTFGTAVPQSGLYTTSVSVPVGSYPSANEQSILVGNFFGNGAIDLAVADSGTTPGVYILKNTSTSTTYSFATPTNIPVTGLVSAQAASVVSTLSDLVVYNGTTLSVLTNSGTGTFSSSYANLTGANTTAFYAAVDANSDGHADLYSATTATNAASVTVSLVSGSATAVSQPFSLPAGANAVSAAWSGNVNFTGSTASGTQNVNLVTTTVGLTSSLNPSAVGDSVTFTGTVSPAASGGFAPSGTLTFTDGTNPIGTTTLDGAVFGSINTSSLTPGSHTITVTYGGDSVFASSIFSISQVVNKIIPTINWGTPAAITYGTALSGTQLNATAINSATDATIPGTFVYTPAAGTVLNTGLQTLSVLFTPTDLTTFTTATGTVSLRVNPAPLTLTSFTPNTAIAGASATTITITGTGFVSNTVAQVNGSNISTTFVSATTVTAIIPAANLTTIATLQISVSNPSADATTATLPFTVTTPPATGVITAPPSSPPGSQPTINFSLSAPYPVPLVATFSVAVVSGIPSGATDPTVQFANGTKTFTVTIPAGQLTIPPFQIQVGTVAATITVPVTLTVNGNPVNTGTLAATIVVPRAVPTATATGLARSGNQLTVTVTGFSNTREIVQANFHFVPITGGAIATPDITAPVGPDFATWFASSTSGQYGSAFTYTQVFTVSDTATNIGSVQVTLTNSVGMSTTYTAQ